MELKQVILVRQDLKMPKGKMAAQVAHASVEAVLRSDPDTVEEWREEGMKKSILKVPDLRTMARYFQNAKSEGLTAALITDAGRTTLQPGTKTCVGIGPDEEEKIDELTGQLKLFN